MNPTVVLSCLSLVVAVVGTVLANKRASDALKESRKAAQASLWANVQEAVQRLIGFDPSREPLGERLANLRIAMIELVDRLDDWRGLDTWLEAERALGAVLGRQVMDQSKPGDTVDERLAILDPYQRWAQVLAMNLRRFRKTGYDESAAAGLEKHAIELAGQVYAANGWQAPPTSLPGVTALGDGA